MNEDVETYMQPQKRKARAMVLSHAVRSLTAKRASSPLVTVKQFALLVSYCVQQFLENAGQDLSSPMTKMQAYWENVHESRVGHRVPNDLKVLFLCGPEPLNDLKERAQSLAQAIGAKSKRQV